ncbi:uncharacterized protein [Primulina huaijiensis]|uniref:uncharacterized protein isoform X2 n=1 Tax=Primulina huaijiensis TaxID=1492673 RepID=UPI003CC70E3B
MRVELENESKRIWKVVLSFNAFRRTNRFSICPRPRKCSMFLSILAHHKKNRVTSHDYMRSGKTVSAHFHEVMRTLLKLYTLLLVKPTTVDANCDSDPWKWFEGCLGALDGTHIGVHVRARDKAKYRTRKRNIAVNVLGVCDRNMNFIYALTGWEGSAADARVLRDALTRDDAFKVVIIFVTMDTLMSRVFWLRTDE